MTGTWQAFKNQSNNNKNKNMDDKLIPFPLACARLGIAPQTGYNQVNLKTFPVEVVKRGKRSYVRDSVLSTYIEGAPAAPPKPKRGRPRSHLLV